MIKITVTNYNYENEQFWGENFELICEDVDIHFHNSYVMFFHEITEEGRILPCNFEAEIEGEGRVNIKNISKLYYLNSKNENKCKLKIGKDIKVKIEGEEMVGEEKDYTIYYDGKRWYNEEEWVIKGIIE